MRRRRSAPTAASTPFSASTLWLRTRSCCTTCTIGGSRLPPLDVRGMEERRREECLAADADETCETKIIDRHTEEGQVVLRSTRPTVHIKFVGWVSEAYQGETIHHRGHGS